MAKTGSESTFPPTLASIEEEFEHLEDWEDRYEFLIELGREIPVLADDFKTAENIVKGCMSTVWLVTRELPDGSVEILADSDSLIVKGLLVVVLSAYAGLSYEKILLFDIQQVFERLGLSQHLSANRRNGLFSMVGRIRQLAAAAA